MRGPEVRPHATFLADYDMLLTEHLGQGVDVWLNTPRRPWEACGTSGMKVLVNGGINLSELDGWWAEAYAPEVGWALGDGREPLAKAALDLFIVCYGALAGDHALNVVARGGAYVSGGIAPKIVRRLAAGAFIAAFNDKGAFSDLARSLPVHVVLNERLGLLGAARVATMP